MQARDTKLNFVQVVSHWAWTTTCVAAQNSLTANQLLFKGSFRTGSSCFLGPPPGNSVLHFESAAHATTSAPATSKPSRLYSANSSYPLSNIFSLNWKMTSGFDIINICCCPRSYEQMLLQYSFTNGKGGCHSDNLKLAPVRSDPSFVAMVTQWAVVTSWKSTTIMNYKGSRTEPWQCLHILTSLSITLTATVIRQNLQVRFKRQGSVGSWLWRENFHIVFKLFLAYCQIKFFKCYLILI